MLSLGSLPNGRGALLALILALVPLALLRGFMVDDALVTARVAHHIATGVGYRFNSDGPVVDAVTPLGWAYVLAAFAGSSVWRAFVAAKWIGAASYALAVMLLGRWISARAGSAWRFAPLLLLLCSASLAAWAVSGMETGFITLLCTLSLARGRAGALAAGSAAALRPELMPWAMVLAFGSAVARHERARGLGLALALALAPPLAVALVRQGLFGEPAPLAVWAKPSDLEHGLVYAVGAAFGTGALPMLAALGGYRSLDAHARAVALAVLVHFGALVLSGGDWMALYRLATPLLPLVIFVCAGLAARAPVWATVSRVGSACALSVVVFATTGVRAMKVGDHRAALIESARQPLAGARHVAALDIGWVGAATDATIVDLAGITDPVIARLPGGHTSKRIPAELLVQRRTDTWVLLLGKGETLRSPWWSTHFDRAVERRVAVLARDIDVKSVALLPLGGTNQRYAVIRARY
ncbi:MAG TPA: hypothetical protein VK524_16130 [Polyangiaceae bacterium]|nr:hypothetical protein [Polyangiaceae bacterium]